MFRKELAAGPQRGADLKELLARRGFPSIAWNGIGLWVDMIRVPPSGTWDQRKADLYGLAEAWVRPAAVTESAGLEHVVRRYLGASARRRCERSPTGPAFPTQPYYRRYIASRCGNFATREGKSSSIFRARHCLILERRHRSASYRRGIRRSWSTLAARRSCRSVTGRWSSTQRHHIPCRPSSSMVRSREPGATRAAGSRSSPSTLFQKPPAQKSMLKRSGWRTSTNKNRAMTSLTHRRRLLRQRTPPWATLTPDGSSRAGGCYAPRWCRGRSRDRMQGTDESAPRVALELQHRSPSSSGRFPGAAP